jgi:hypothetical protein
MNRNERQRERWLLVGLVAALALLPAGFVAGDETANPAPADAALTEAGDGTNSAERQVVLYYLHGARRCNTCRSIESYAKGVVNSRFADAVEAGTLTWKVVNYDTPENQHFVDDFGLYTSSLVIVEMEQGKTVSFEVLQEAWSLVRDKTKFQQYVYRSLHEHIG